MPSQPRWQPAGKPSARSRVRGARSSARPARLSRRMLASVALHLQWFPAQVGAVKSLARGRHVEARSNSAIRKAGHEDRPRWRVPDALFVNVVETLPGVKFDGLDRLPLTIGVPGVDAALVQIGGLQFVLASPLLDHRFEPRI